MEHNAYDPASVAAAFREQAARLIRMAEAIEREIPGRTTRQAPPRPQMSPQALPTPERIKQLMAGRNLRQADIAAELGISDPETLTPVLTEANGFFRGLRGWISLKPQEPQFVAPALPRPTH
ncbi:MAG: hypothetical protein AMXMBFR58_15300 [Phycisphaerae bacterium]